MVETVGQVLLSPVKGCFTTVHVEGEFVGEVEPQFAEEFKWELGMFWRLYDKDGLNIRVQFDINGEVPILTDGWMTLREHYGFQGHHQMFFKYFGNNQFQIIPDIDNRIYPSKFPTWHSRSRCLRKAVTFNLTMTDDPEIIPQLTLPEDMGEYLWETMLDRVVIMGTIGEKYTCELEYETDPFVVRISHGWVECVGINGFRVGDRLQFNIRNIYDGHLIRVKKLT